MIGEKILDGSISLSSSGSNNLNNTNDLKTSISNDVKYSSLGYINKLGLRNQYNLLFKNNNLIGKNPNIDLVHKLSWRVYLSLLVLCL